MYLYIKGSRRFLSGAMFAIAQLVQQRGKKNKKGLLLVKNKKTE
ncbi:hypothetical protein ACNKHO_19705 [Shigella flexneri]